MKMKLAPLILVILLASTVNVGNAARSYVPTCTKQNAAIAAGIAVGAAGLIKAYRHCNNADVCRQIKRLTLRVKSYRWDRKTLLKVATITAVIIAIAGGLYYYQPDLLGAVTGYVGKETITDPELALEDRGLYAPETGSYSEPSESLIEYDLEQQRLRDLAHLYKTKAEEAAARDACALGYARLRLALKQGPGGMSTIYDDPEIALDKPRVTIAQKPL